MRSSPSLAGVLAMAALALPCHAAGTSPRVAAVRAPAPPAPAPIDVNSASRAQLKTLPGIGDVEADRVISGRPYFSKADLATREVLPEGLYFALKSRIIATQKPGAGAKVRPR
jgi:DNA uptake protein ComE-like DNA-binding protein